MTALTDRIDRERDAAYREIAHSMRNDAVDPIILNEIARNSFLCETCARYAESCGPLEEA